MAEFQLGWPKLAQISQKYTRFGRKVWLNFGRNLEALGSTFFSLLSGIKFTLLLLKVKKTAQ
jgi:hypothetical protein